MARTGEQETVWELKPHTEAKHRLLTGYLAAWFPILSRWNDRILFFDGFAGPGVYESGEAGSPTKALDVLLNHQYGAAMANKKFVFMINEAERDRHERLTEVITRYMAEHQPWPRTSRSDRLRQLREHRRRILSGLAEQKKNLAPTFAFVDPFGVKGLPMDLLRRLLSFDRCELFVYFDFNTVNRFANAGNIDDRLTELFGTDLFKQAVGLKGDDRKSFLHDLYQSQLARSAGSRSLRASRWSAKPEDWLLPLLRHPQHQGPGSDEGCHVEGRSGRRPAVLRQARRSGRPLRRRGRHQAAAARHGGALPGADGQRRDAGAVRPCRHAVREEAPQEGDAEADADRWRDLESRTRGQRTPIRRGR